MSKAKETTARNPSVGEDGGQPSKTYTQISAETADRLCSDLSLKLRRATMRNGCDDCDDVFGGGILSSHRCAERKLAPQIGTSLSLSCDIKHKSC